MKRHKEGFILGRKENYGICHHLDYSEIEQCKQEIFTTKALNEIHKASSRISWMLNRICEQSCDSS